MATDIFARLEKDHREMEQMLTQLSEKFDKALFTKLATELVGHERAEEDVLYKAIVDDERTRTITLEGYEEHHVADLIMKELKANEPGTERWMAKLSVLKENVEHHIEEEEGEMFKAGRQVVPSDRAIEMVSEFETEKKKHS